MDKKEQLERIIKDFCKEFLEKPYLCYTEHGCHAYFYSYFLNKWKEYGNKVRVQMPCGQEMCVIQKEFPTLSKLIFITKRQHWDIAILEEEDGKAKIIDELKNKNLKEQESLKLFAVIEFGMNADKGHFGKDINRIMHKDAIGRQFDYGYIVNLVRIGDISGRDRFENRFAKAPKDETGKVIVYHVVSGESSKVDGIYIRGEKHSI